MCPRGSMWLTSRACCSFLCGLTPACLCCVRRAGTWRPTGIVRTPRASWSQGLHGTHWTNTRPVPCETWPQRSCGQSKYNTHTACTSCAINSQAKLFLKVAPESHEPQSYFTVWLTIRVYLMLNRFFSLVSEGKKNQKPPKISSSNLIVEIKTETLK